MQQNLNEAQGLLFQIHSMADLLVGKYQELADNKAINESNMISSPILSIAEIITEKAEACLNKLELIEASMNEERKTPSSAAYIA